MAQHGGDWFSFWLGEALKVLDGLCKRAEVDLRNVQELKMLALVIPLFDELLDVEVAVVLQDAEHAGVAQVYKL